MKMDREKFEKRMQEMDFLYGDNPIPRVYNHLMPYDHVYIHIALFDRDDDKEYINLENIAMTIMVIFPFGRRGFTFADAFLPFDALMEEIGGTHGKDEFDDFLRERLEKIHDSFWLFCETTYEYEAFEVDRYLNMVGATADADEMEAIQSWSYYLHDRKDLAYRNWHLPGVS